MQSFALRDSHKLVSMLVQHGFTAQQAEALAEAMRSIDASDIATKGDLKQLELALTKTIDALKFDLIKWLVGTQLAYGAVIVGILVAN